MAATIVTITIAEADAPRVIKALCALGGLEESGANAKAALIAHVKQLVIAEARREATVSSPELK